MNAPDNAYDSYDSFDDDDNEDELDGQQEQHFQEGDRRIECNTCGAEFVFTAEEAQSFAQRNLVPPKRCKECRAANGARNRSHAPGRGRSNAPPGGGPQRNSRFPRFTGDVNEYRSPMMDSSYPSQGNSQWPARPSPRFSSRPPYRDDGNYRAPSFGGNVSPSYGPPRQSSFPRNNSRFPQQGASEMPRRPRAMYSITCNNCGQESQVPFKPDEGRDVFCQACYRARKPQPQQ